MSHIGEKDLNGNLFALVVIGGILVAIFILILITLIVICSKINTSKQTVTEKIKNQTYYQKAESQIEDELS